MWKRIKEWFRSFGAKQKPLDPVVIAPVVYPGVPVVPVPLDPPPKPPTERTECLPNTVHVFCEAGGADDYEWWIKATGRPASEVIIHAIRGTSKLGRTLRLIHPWYDPCKRSIDIPSFVAQAKREGCVGLTIDYEGWVLGKGPDWLRMVSAECRKQGMILSVVPKLNLEHITGAWGLSEDEASKVISETCDICVEWQYVTTGDQYCASFIDLVACQQVGLVDGAGRYNDAATRRGWVLDMRAKGLSVGVFLPKDTDLASAFRASDYKLSMAQKFKRALNVGDEKIA
jgi:hypothetical protein